MIPVAPVALVMAVIGSAILGMALCSAPSLIKLEQLKFADGQQ